MNNLFPESCIFRISQGNFAKVLYIKSAFSAIKNRKKTIRVCDYIFWQLCSLLLLSPPVFIPEATGSQ